MLLYFVLGFLALCLWIIGGAVVFAFYMSEDVYGEVAEKIPDWHFWTVCTACGPVAWYVVAEFLWQERRHRNDNRS